MTNFWDGVRALGSKLGLEAADAAAALIAPRHRVETHDNIEIRRDVAYGPHERHRLDIFRPRQGVEGKSPVLVYVCGGGFVGGDKSSGPYFTNIGLWAARHGITAVTLNHRLAPEFKWPSAAEDIGRAVSWIKSGAEFGTLGGICLMGHSAGAAHVAAYVSHKELHGPGGAGVSLAILVSGLYDIRLQRETRVGQAYYGEDPELYAARSAVPQIKEVRLPVAVVVSEFDPPMLQREALIMITALTERDNAIPPIIRLHRHNHFTGVLSIDLEFGAQLEQGILDLMSVYC